MMPYLVSEWGNPSSAYRFGARAKAAVEKARAQVAALVNARPEEVVFTSCATEANNTAIHSALMANPAKRHVVTSQVEHSSVLHYCQELERRGYEVTYLPVCSEGLLDLNQLERAIRPDTAVVSLMWANNETGVIWPVKAIGEICLRCGVLYHCDAVQAVGKIPVDFTGLPIQFLTLSGHKLGAPKGIGALVVRDGVYFHALILGGKQEAGRRGGTECVPLIVALGEAARIAQTRTYDDWARIAAIRDAFDYEILASVPSAYRNGAKNTRLPNTTNLGFTGCDNDALVTFCDRNGICISSGSACLESAISPSHVILSMTRSHDKASESIRVSIGCGAKDTCLQALTRALKQFTQTAM